MIWQIEYEFRSPIPTEQQIEQYPRLGLSLKFDSARRIECLRHLLAAPEGAEATAVIHESERSLSLFFQILEFMHGLPIEVKSIRACTTSTEQRATAPRSSFVCATLGAAIACTVKLPTEAMLSGVNPRFTALLYMFNAARPPASDAEAVRLYGLICESLQGPGGSSAVPLEVKHLRYARDFVSHGVKLDRNPDAIAYIASKLGKTIEAYDPTDKAHSQFVAMARVAAEQLVRTKLYILL